jgi:hypothetical protein
MIIYASIARASDGAVLVECCDPLLKGNAALVTSMLMQHFRDHPELVAEGDRRTFIQRNSEAIDSFDFYFSNFIEACSTALGEDLVEENYFHFYSKNGVFYGCIGDDPDPKDQKVYVCAWWTLVKLNCGSVCANIVADLFLSPFLL